MTSILHTGNLKEGNCSDKRYYKKHKYIPFGYCIITKDGCCEIKCPRGYKA